MYRMGMYIEDDLDDEPYTGNAIWRDGYFYDEPRSVFCIEHMPQSRSGGWYLVAATNEPCVVCTNLACAITMLDTLPTLVATSALLFGGN